MPKESITRRPSLDEIVEYLERRKKAVEFDGGYGWRHASDAYEISLDFVRNAQFDFEIEPNSCREALIGLLQNIKMHHDKECPGTMPVDCLDSIYESAELAQLALNHKDAAVKTSEGSSNGRAAGGPAPGTPADAGSRPAPPTNSDDASNASFRAGWDDAVDTMVRVLGERFTRCSNRDRHDPKDGSVLVSVTYFKRSGKYYTTDESVEWPPDPEHYSGWAPLSSLHRIKDMFAVCFENPLGFPQFSRPLIAEDDRHSGEALAEQAVYTWLRGLATGRLTLGKMREAAVTLLDFVDWQVSETPFAETSGGLDAQAHREPGLSNPDTTPARGPEEAGTCHRCGGPWGAGPYCRDEGQRRESPPDLHAMATYFTRQNMRDLSEASTSTIKFRARLVGLLEQVWDMGAASRLRMAKAPGEK